VLADDDARWKLGPVEQARAACSGGAAVVQLRAKSATDRQALEWAKEIRAITRACDVLFFVNDRFDIALAADADGVHLGQEDLPPGRVPEAARRVLAIGRSTHTTEQAAAARDEPIDYVAFGPVYGTHSKVSEYAKRGVARLAKIVQIVAPRPVIAIGGITAQHLPGLCLAGAAGFAVISAVAGADDPVAATRSLVSAHRAARERAETETS
jgi:thiamine-phosphate pyrophosphorylase